MPYIGKQRWLSWNWSALRADDNDKRISEGRESTWTVIDCMWDHQYWVIRCTGLWMNQWFAVLRHADNADHPRCSVHARCSWVRVTFTSKDDEILNYRLQHKGRIHCVSSAPKPDLSTFPSYNLFRYIYIYIYICLLIIDKPQLKW